MINKKIKRFNVVFFILISFALATFFVLKALKEKIVFFYSPTNLVQSEDEVIDYIRLGGLVKENSINYSADGLKIKFTITDNTNSVNVVYNGILPDLFREKQGVVVEGNFNKYENTFFADRVLAKHDENYMPPEVKKVLGD